MNMELSLYIPKPEEYGAYVRMITDPKTMAYNAPWFPPDGCIKNPMEDWENLVENWIGHEPERFFAYLMRKADGAFVGNVNYHYNAVRDWWDMGVLILASERCKGYGRQGLQLLIKHAFSHGVHTLHNEFETTRVEAYRMHINAGFRETGRENGVIQLMLTEKDIQA